MKSKLLAASGVVAVAAAALTGCSTGPAEASCTNEILQPDATQVSVWAWYPAFEQVVDVFNENHDDVQICWTNAGQGNDEYTKFSTAIESGSGAPDVIMLESEVLSSFSIRDALVDLTKFGADDVKADYTEGAWKDVSSGDAVYAIPVDGGPMGMLYRKDILDQYGIAVPTTWDEYVQAARDLHAADPTKYITSDTGDSGFTTSMIWQAGGRPFGIDGTDITIDLADEGTQKWTGVWNQLVQEDLLATTPGWSDEWFKGLADGSIASLVIGAWMPGVLESSVPDAAGDWRVAPMPTYDGTPVAAENGGGGQSVVKQSKNPALAAAFLRWLNSDPESIDIFLESGGFPSTTADLEDPDFVGLESDYFGGQKINEVLTQASKDVASGWSYLPYQVYANSIFGDTVGQSYANKVDLDEGLADWQDQLVEYGNSQGFTVDK